MQIISDNDHRNRAKAVHVVRVVSTADSRTERLHVLLTASNSCHCIARMYLIEPSLISAGFPKKEMPPSNSSRPRIVAGLK